MIDRNPKEGRWVVLDSQWIGGVFGHVGKITRTSKSRVYYVLAHNIGKEQEPEEFCLKYAAICDTREEAEALFKFSMDHVKGQMEQSRKHKEECKAILERGYIVDDSEAEICPDCGKKSVYAKRSGGVACRTPNCGYWFCF